MTSNSTIQHDVSTYDTMDNERQSNTLYSDLPSCSSSPLVNERPSSQRKAHIHIQHLQLRNLIHPTEQRGVVYTVQANAVVRYDLKRLNQPPKTVTRLDFNPTTLAYSPTHNLLAVGGPKANLIIVQLPSVEASSHWRNIQTSIRQIRIPHPGSSIINSVSFADLPSSSSTTRETRLLVSSNEQTVRIYRISPPTERNATSPSHTTDGSRTMRILQEAVVQYSTCVNHASISPDGQTLLSVGDEPEVYLHSLSSLSPPTPLHSTVTASLRSNASPPYGLIYSTSDFGYSPSEIRFSMSASKHITMRAPKPILTIPTALCDSEMTGRTRELVSCAPRSLNTQALFSTAWSGDGWKFAAGSQDGIVQVWDVRNLKRRLQHFRTIQNSGRTSANSQQGEVDSSHPCMGKTWGVRTLRFNPSAALGGRELLVFSEHQSHLNVVDARTFDPATCQVLHLPSILHRNPITQSLPKRRNASSVFHKPVVDDPREGKKRKRSALDPSSATLPSPTRRLVEGERLDVASQSSTQQYTIPGLREILAQSFDLQSDAERRIDPSFPGVSTSEQLLHDVNPLSQHTHQNRTEDEQSSAAAHASSEASGSRAVADAVVERQIVDILEASDRMARRLRGVNSQLEQMAAFHSSALPSSSTNVASSSTPRVTVTDTSLQSPSRPLAPPIAEGHGSLSAPARRVTNGPLRSARRDGILNRLQQREMGSPNGLTARNSGLSSSRTRERVDEVRRASDALSAMVEQYLNSDITAPGVQTRDENNLSDEDLTLPRSAEPSFSRDLTRGVMRRWSRPGTNSPLNEQMTTASNDATTQTEEDPSDHVEQDGVDNENSDEENDAFWASIGMELDAQSAVDMGFDEPSSLRRARMLIDPALATAGGSDSETDGHESPRDPAQLPSRNFELNVGRSISSAFRREGSVSNLTPVQRRLRVRQLQALQARVEAQETTGDVSLVAHPRTQTVTPLRSTSFYQHSNEGMDELLETPNNWASPGNPPVLRPLFTASPESSPPLDRDPRPPTSRSIGNILNDISARRTRFATSLSSTRPFSSRIYGNPMFYGLPSDGRYRDGEDNVIDGEDVVMDNEDTPLDVAGFGFGVPGTESQGYLYVGTMAKEGRGGRLIEFDLARGVATKHNEDESSGEEYEEESESEDAWNGRRGGWIGKRYAQGSWV